MHKELIAIKCDAQRCISCNKLVIHWIRCKNCKSVLCFECETISANYGEPEMCHPCLEGREDH